MTAVVASLSSAGASQASLLLNKPSSLAGPALLASYAVFRHIKDRCEKNTKARSSRLSSTLIACQSNLPALPKLSISATADGPCSWLSACASKEKISQPFSSVSSSHSGEQVLGGIPALPGRRRSLRPPGAYFKNDHFSFKYPVLTEKPKWWMRALATLPYLVALQMSYAGYLFQPLVQRHEAFGQLSFWVPGAITRLPTWFVMVYSYCVYIWIVKNKDWPHFLRFHFVMGMLLEILLQVFWTASNFFPVIQYDGMLGLYYWAVVGAAFMFLTLLCVGCALSGNYARVPIVGDAAFIHTLFFMGGSSQSS